MCSDERTHLRMFGKIHRIMQFSRHRPGRRRVPGPAASVWKSGGLRPLDICCEALCSPSAPASFFFVPRLLSAAVSVTDLRCEYRTNPSRHRHQPAAPQLAPGRHGRIEIRQTDQPTRCWWRPLWPTCGPIKGDLWDSGKVESDQSVHVVYAGKPLTSGVKAFWKVQIEHRRRRIGLERARRTGPWACWRLPTGKAKWIGRDEDEAAPQSRQSEPADCGFASGSGARSRGPASAISGSSSAVPAGRAVKRATVVIGRRQQV